MIVTVREASESFLARRADEPLSARPTVTAGQRPEVTVRG
jgi:hypothetical protein